MTIEFRVANHTFSSDPSTPFEKVVDRADFLALLYGATVEVSLNDFPIFTRTPEQARVRESTP